MRAGSRANAWRRTAVVAVSLALAAAFAALDGASGRLILDAGTAAVLVVLSAIDLRERILPNRIVIPAAAVALVAHAAIAPGHALEWALAALGAAAFLLVPLLFHPAGMGYGDVKLALLLGAWLGRDVLPAILFAFVAVLPVALFLIARHGAAGRRMTIPFGPFLAFGAVLVALGGAGG